MFLDLVKAFDRVPREPLWKVLHKFGVPAKVVRLIQALHAKVNVEFTVHTHWTALSVSNKVTYLDLLYSLCTLLQS